MRGRVGKKKARDNLRTTPWGLSVVQCLRLGTLTVGARLQSQQGARSCMLQLRIPRPQLKNPLLTATKTQDG